MLAVSPAIVLLAARWCGRARIQRTTRALFVDGARCGDGDRRRPHRAAVPRLFQCYRRWVGGRASLVARLQPRLGPGRSTPGALAGTGFDLASESLLAPARRRSIRRSARTRCTTCNGEATGPTTGWWIGNLPALREPRGVVRPELEDFEQRARARATDPLAQIAWAEAVAASGDSMEPRGISRWSRTVLVRIRASRREAPAGRSIEGRSLGRLRSCTGRRQRPAAAQQRVSTWNFESSRNASGCRPCGARGQIGFSRWTRWTRSRGVLGGSR